MSSDLVNQYAEASRWAGSKVSGAPDLDAQTPCDEWKVRELLSHVLDTQRYFVAAGRGEDAAPPSATPPPLSADDPAGALEKTRTAMVEVYGQDGVVEKTGPLLGIAMADMLLHGWDLARATGQDATMPDGLAQAAYECIHGRFTDEQRAGTFGPEIPVGDDASPQQRLLAYTGRDPG